MMTRFLSIANIVLLIINALGCYVIWFSLDHDQALPEQVTELRLAAMLILALHGFLFGIVSPPFTRYLLEQAELKMLWEYTEEGIHGAWYGICLGVGVITSGLLLQELWPSFFAPMLLGAGAEQSTTSPSTIPFVALGLILGFGCMMLRIGQLPPNPIAGYRLPSVMASPAKWSQIHHLAQRYVPMATVIGAIAMLFAVPADSKSAELWAAGIIVISVAIPILLFYRSPADPESKPKS